MGSTLSVDNEPSLASYRSLLLDSGANLGSKCPNVNRKIVMNTKILGWSVDSEPYLVMLPMFKSLSLSKFSPQNWHCLVTISFLKSHLEELSTLTLISQIGGGNFGWLGRTQAMGSILSVDNELSLASYWSLKLDSGAYLGSKCPNVNRKFVLIKTSSLQNVEADHHFRDFAAF